MSREADTLLQPRAVPSGTPSWDAYPDAGETFRESLDDPDAGKITALNGQRVSENTPGLERGGSESTVSVL
jgi:hypothetical protein